MPSPVLVGETMDMPLSAVDMSVDMADAGELNPGFLSQVHAGGIVSLALYHVPYLILPGARSLAAVHPALCKEHRGPWTPFYLRHIPQAAAFISRPQSFNERIRLHRSRILA